MGLFASPEPVGMGSKTILFNSVTKLNREKRPKFKSYFTYKMGLKQPKVIMESKSAPAYPRFILGRSTLGRSTRSTPGTLE